MLRKEISEDMGISIAKDEYQNARLKCLNGEFGKTPQSSYLCKVPMHGLKIPSHLITGGEGSQSQNSILRLKVNRHIV